MSTFEELDAWIQEKFQKFSDWSQIHWNKNCYWWAYMGTHASGVWLLIIGYLKLRMVLSAETSVGIWVWNIMFVAVIAALALSNFFRLHKLKQASESNAPRLDLYQLGDEARLFDLLIGLFGMLILDYVLPVFIMFGVVKYFLRCSPKPPLPDALRA